jgi:hypothetical protein
MPGDCEAFMQKRIAADWHRDQIRRGVCLILADKVGAGEPASGFRFFATFTGLLSGAAPIQ